MKPGKYKETAIILRKTNYSEADLIVSFLTRDFGKIDGLAKYGRRSIKRFGNVLGSIGLVELYFKVQPGRDLDVQQRRQIAGAATQ